MLMRRLLMCSIALSVLFVQNCYSGEFLATSNAEVGELRRKVRAAVFLTKATFGPKPSEVNALAARMKQIGRKRAFEEWIDDQFELPATSHRKTAMDMIRDDNFTFIEEDIGHNRYKDHAWWHIAVNAPDQLRQRVAWALSQICVVNERGGGFGDLEIDGSGLPKYLGQCHYYDMLANNATTNYRQVLQDVSVHPIMGIFLSHFRNRKPDPARGILPDENYAREVMQLMSIGLYELRINGQFRRRSGKLIDTYDNETIKAFARVFTGLSYKNGDGNFWGGANLNEPMQAFEQYHDTDPKTVLRGVTLSANQSTMDDVSDGLDNIFDHPNVPPFISRLLIQRLVKANPSKGYIRRVARVFKRNRERVRGDMKSIIKAILLDREALGSMTYRRMRRPYRLRVTPKGTEYSSLREPVLAQTAFLRAFPISNSYPTGRTMMNNPGWHLAQAPYESPSVFNFFLPDYQPPGPITNYVASRRLPNGDLNAPVFTLMTGVTANRTANRYRGMAINAQLYSRMLNNSKGLLENTITFDFSEQQALAGDPAALLTHLDLLLCHGSMSDRTKNIIASAIDEETSDLSLRARTAILAVLNSPDFMVTE